MSTSRVFAAVPVPASVGQEIRSQLSGLIREFEDLRWTAPEQFHVTIEFFGDVDDRELPRVCEALRDASEGLAPFPLTFGKLGTFPAGKLPRVLWVGVSQGAEELTQVHRHLREELRGLGIAGTAKAYVPHVTLARLSKKQTEQLGQRLLDEVSGNAEVNLSREVHKMVLLASIKEHGELVYNPVCTQVLQ